MYAPSIIYDSNSQVQNYTVCMIYHIRGIFGGGFNLVEWQIMSIIAKLNVRHLGCRHGFLSMQYSKLPIKTLTNCILRVIHQIFDLPIIPHIWYAI